MWRQDTSLVEQYFYCLKECLCSFPNMVLLRLDCGRGPWGLSPDSVKQPVQNQLRSGGNRIRFCPHGVGQISEWALQILFHCPKLGKHHVCSVLLVSFCCSSSPLNQHAQLVDYFYKVNDKETFHMSRKLIRDEGLLCGRLPDCWLCHLVLNVLVTPINLAVALQAAAPARPWPQPWRQLSSWRKDSAAWSSWPTLSVTTCESQRSSFFFITAFRCHSWETPIWWNFVQVKVSEWQMDVWKSFSCPRSPSGAPALVGNQAGSTNPSLEEGWNDTFYLF